MVCGGGGGGGGRGGGGIHFFPTKASCIIVFRPGTAAVM